MMELNKDNKESPMSTTDYQPVIDFDDPSARLALLEKVGIPEYNRLNLEAVSSDKSKGELYA